MNAYEKMVLLRVCIEKYFFIKCNVYFVMHEKMILQWNALKNELALKSIENDF